MCWYWNEEKNEEVAYNEMGYECNIQKKLIP